MLGTACSIHAIFDKLGAILFCVGFGVSSLDEDEDELVGVVRVGGGDVVMVGRCCLISGDEELLELVVESTDKLGDGGGGGCCVTASQQPQLQVMGGRVLVVLSFCETSLYM